MHVSHTEEHIHSTIRKFLHCLLGKIWESKLISAVIYCATNMTVKVCIVHFFSITNFDLKNDKSVLMYVFTSVKVSLLSDYFLLPSWTRIGFPGRCEIQTMPPNNPLSDRFIQHIILYKKKWSEIVPNLCKWVRNILLQFETCYVTFLPIPVRIFVCL